jgi:hypothetical protein
MYNSWGKFPPSGIIEGTVTNFGDYNQCLAIKPNEMIGESQYTYLTSERKINQKFCFHFITFFTIESKGIHFLNKKMKTVIFILIKF